MKINPVFDPDPDGRDPLDMIVRNRDTVRHLRGNRIDTSVINRILLDTQGREMEVPVKITRAFAAYNRKIEYALRHINAFMKNDAITEEERVYLSDMRTRLRVEHVPLKTDKRGRKMIKIKMQPEEGKDDEPGYKQAVQKKAKTRKQMIGRQVAALYKYIQPFYRLQPRRKIIYELIAELLEVVWQEKFTIDQIANLDRNNC